MLPAIDYYIQRVSGKNCTVFHSIYSKMVKTWGWTVAITVKKVTHIGRFWVYVLGPPREC